MKSSQLITTVDLICYSSQFINNNKKKKKTSAGFLVLTDTFTCLLFFRHEYHKDNSVFRQPIKISYYHPLLWWAHLFCAGLLNATHKHWKSERIKLLLWYVSLMSSPSGVNRIRLLERQSANSNREFAYIRTC